MTLLSKPYASAFIQNEVLIGEQIDWGALKEFLRLAKKAARSDSYREADVAISSSRETIEIFFKFLTSKAGLFLKEPLVHELAEAIDGMYDAY